MGLPQQSAGLPALTIVRWWAALAVVWFHYGQALTPTSLETMAGAGYNGVALFFILSGFIMVYASRAQDTPRAFWWRRFARIYPVYLFAWLLFGVHVWLTHQPAYAAKATAYYGGLSLGLVQLWVPGAASWWNWPGWSLSAEGFFYAIFPTLTVVVERGSIVAWLLGSLVVAAALRVPFLPEYVAGLPPLLASQFALGVALGHVFKRRGPCSSRLWPWLAAACLAVLAIPSPALRDPILIGLFAGLIYALASASIRDDWRTSLLVRLGQASYAVYILQAPVWLLYWRVRGQAPNRSLAGAVAVYLVVLLGLALLSYTAIERPCERWLRALTLGGGAVERFAGSDPAAQTPRECS